jgi:DnaK suppressor protein
VELEGIEQRLREKERELSLDIARLEVEARAAGDAGVHAASSQSASESLLEGSLASQTLTQVQDALHRIEAATYGKCIDCGRQIEPARLQAIPWSSYCLEDQEKQDKAAHVQQGGSTI